MDSQAAHPDFPAPILSPIVWQGALLYQTKLQADTGEHQKYCLFLCPSSLASLLGGAGSRHILGEKGRAGIQDGGAWAEEERREERKAILEPPVLSKTGAETLETPNHQKMPMGSSSRSLKASGPYQPLPLYPIPRSCFRLPPCQAPSPQPH